MGVWWMCRLLLANVPLYPLFLQMRMSDFFINSGDGRHGRPRLRSGLLKLTSLSKPGFEGERETRVPRQAI